MEVIAVGPEVVVDHVQHDAHLQAVRRIDEGLQFIGRAVGGVRRVRQHAVVAPVARAGKIRDGHEFEQRDAQLWPCTSPSCSREAGSGTTQSAASR
ncbi:Uncharacterised protein [Bordetella pertussis]|nr:Uncharacterised protein [Bordetella pertussis]